MFDSISAIGVVFGSIILLIGTFAAVGIGVRKVRERRYQSIT